jgi:Sugar (and other) transporter
LDGTASQLLATGLNGVVSVIATIPAVMFIDRWGRVKTLLVGGTGMGITMLLAGALLGGKCIFNGIT